MERLPLRYCRSNVKMNERGRDRCEGKWYEWGRNRGKGKRYVIDVKERGN